MRRLPSTFLVDRISGRMEDRDDDHRVGLYGVDDSVGKRPHGSMTASVGMGAKRFREGQNVGDQSLKTGQKRESQAGLPVFVPAEGFVSFIESPLACRAASSAREGLQSGARLVLCDQQARTPPIGGDAPIRFPLLLGGQGGGGVLEKSVREFDLILVRKRLGAPLDFHPCHRRILHGRHASRACGGAGPAS